MIYIVWLTTIIINVLCSCPQFTPNHNVIVSCYNLQGGTALRRISCNFNGTKTGTIVINKCNKYFKPSSRRLDVGKLTCNANGAWDNLLGINEFPCELDCGKRPALKNELISFGNKTSPDNWPWIATIFIQTAQGYRYACSGSIIGVRTVLTAAHCVINPTSKKAPAQDLQKFLGSFSSIYERNIKQGAHSYSVRSLNLCISSLKVKNDICLGGRFIHPDFNSQSLTADVALIQLNKRVTLTDYALPICLPLNYDHDALVTSPSSIGQIASFGLDKTGLPAKSIQSATVKILTSVDCKAMLNTVPQQSQYCGGNTKGANICRGDSGSGMVIRSTVLHETKYTIHGIVSGAGAVQNDCSPVAMFTTVYPFMKWIQETLTSSEISIRNQVGSSPKESYLVPLQAQRTHLEHYSKEERRALAKLREMVKNILLENYMYADEYLTKFLRTKDLDLRNTKIYLQENMKWRRKNRVGRVLRKDFRNIKKDYTAVLQGFDKLGRPVSTYLMSFYDINKVSGNYKILQRYMIRNLEAEAKKIRSIGLENISQSIGIFDLHGFNTRQHLCGPCASLYIYWITTYETYYPQQNYMSFFINMPGFFAQFLEIVRPFFSEYTSQHVRFFRNNKEEWSKALLEYIPRDQLFKVYGGTKIATRSYK